MKHFYLKIRNDNRIIILGFDKMDESLIQQTKYPINTYSNLQKLPYMTKYQFFLDLCGYVEINR